MSMDNKNKGKSVFGIYVLYTAISLLFAHSIFVANRTFMPCLVIAVGCASATFAFT